MVCLKATLNLCLLRHNYTKHCNIITVLIRYMHSSMVIALIHYACNYNVSMLCTGGSIGIRRCFNSTLNVILLLHISKPHFVQGLSVILANHMHAWTHTCKNGGYSYFTCLYPVVSSNSNPVLQYWHKYPMLKLSSISRSSALILVHIIKNNFNSIIVQVLSIVIGTSD